MKFNKKVLIVCEIDKAFNFHLNPENISRISPPGLSAKIVKITDSPLKLNSEVTLEVKQFFFTSEWLVKISEFIEPNVICDEQLKGVFKYWKHYHIFEQDANGTRMTDRIFFTPPFGFFGLLASPFILLGLWIMFTVRHKKTKEILEK